MVQVCSFPPLLGRAPRILVLGSMPGKASLDAGQYYAHPRNAFWPVIEAIFGIERTLPYAQRCRHLVDRGVAVWDVLASCHRPGSLDADIDPASIVVNDIGGLLEAHRTIERICFNGSTAEKVFRRRALPDLPDGPVGLQMIRLPSTSPAHAAMTLAQKIERWRAPLTT